MRQFVLTLGDIFDGIRGQRGRFALSSLAVAIGVIALTLLIAVLTALHDKSERLVQELGADVVGILHGPQKHSPNTGLRLRHADLLQRNFPTLSVSTIRRYEAPTLGTRQQLAVVATDDALLQVRQWRLQAGRFLDRGDLMDRDRHAVISGSLSRAWNWELGSIIYLGETPFQVVGIVDIGGDAIDEEASDPRLSLGDRVVLIPRTVIPYWSRQVVHRFDSVDAIFVRGQDGQNARQILSALQRALVQPDQHLGKVSWITPETLIQGVSRLQQTISLVAGTIAALCLILGGTTLMSLMVANVRDRVTEIGLRRALGATHRDIAALFVIEAGLITLCAGLLGTAAAHALLWLTADMMPLPFQPGWLSLSIPPLTAVLLGVLFAYGPARAAARIMPSEALRDE